jgi:GntR family histidine utilization transcriptional repressor
MTLDQRIRSDIEARIRSGEWRPGDRIPFEHQLVTTYGCSRATVSKAIEALARTGLIERRRKAGSFVAHRHLQSAVLDVPDLAEVIAARGEVYRWERVERRIATASDLSGETGIADQALLIVGIHHCGSEPFALEHRLIALATVPDAGQETFGAIAPGTWLLGHVPWSDARHRITAVEASPAQARALKVRPRTACLQVARWTWRGDQPVTYVRQLFRGDRYDLVADFKLGRAAPSGG